MMSTAVLTSLHYAMVVVVQVEDSKVSEVVMRTTLAMASYAPLIAGVRPLHLQMRPPTKIRPKSVGAIDFATGPDSMAESLVVADRFVVLVVQGRGDQTFANVAGLFLIERPMHSRFLGRQIGRASNRGKSVVVNGDVVRAALDPLGHCK